MTLSRQSNRREFPLIGMLRLADLPLILEELSRALALPLMRLTLIIVSPHPWNLLLLAILLTPG